MFLFRRINLCETKWENSTLQLGITGEHNKPIDGINATVSNNFFDFLFQSTSQLAHQVRHDKSERVKWVIKYFTEQIKWELEY